MIGILGAMEVSQGDRMAKEVDDFAMVRGSWWSIGCRKEARIVALRVIAGALSCKEGSDLGGCLGVTICGQCESIC